MRLYKPIDYVLMGALLALFAFVGGCDEDEVVIACSNSALVCEATNPNPWPRACDVLPPLHCWAADVHEAQSGHHWPCPCVGPGLEKQTAQGLSAPTPE